MIADEFGRLARVITAPLLLVSVTGEILAANPAATALCSAFVPGRRFDEALIDERPGSPLLRTWSQHGSPVPARLRVRGAAGPVELRALVARVELSGGPAVLINARRDPAAPFAQLNDQLLHLHREVRYRIAAERERAAALAAVQAAHARLMRVQRLSGALAAALDTEDVIAALLAHAAAAADAQGAVVAIRQTDALEISTGDMPPAAGVPDRSLDLDESHPLSVAARLREPQFYATPDELAAVVGDAPPGTRLYLAAALPLSAGEPGPPLGALGLLYGRERWLTADERAVADLVALLCGQALERARLFDHERRFAEMLQFALLPERLPELEHFDLAVAYLPASEQAAVGGDWYDVIPLGADSVGLIVGDVAGHGPAAATAMAQMRNALRAFVSYIADPGDALAAFNDYLCSQLPDDMATVVYAVVDHAAATLSYANAGHPPPLLRHGDRHRYLRKVLGPPAGVTPDQSYATATLTLHGRVRVICYSDGLIERRDEPIDFGLRRLERAATADDADADTLCAGVVKRLVGEGPLDDDAVALVADAVLRDGDQTPGHG